MNKQLKIYLMMVSAALLLLAACGPAPVPDGVAVEEEPTGEMNEDGETEANPHQPAADLPTELEITVLTEGDGAVAQAGDIVTINYTIGLPGEEPFDSSFERGQPISIPLGIGQLLSGWEEALLDMQEGGKVSLLMPPEFAFGEQGLPGIVPPNSAIESELELISVERPEPPIDIADDEYTETDTGLKLYDMEEGDGTAVVTGDHIVMNFSIWRDDDVIVGRSADSGEPISIVVGSGELFPGWDEGVIGMSVGGKRQLVIPPELAFGEEGAGDAVPPNTTLIIEVELLEIVEMPTITDVADEDYITTESGLKYYDIVEGDGAAAESGQAITVHYTGWLTDGTVFDSSVERNQPLPFTLGQGSVIAGWDEGVVGMKVGGKRQLVIPADLAYGAEGRPGIPPDATLIFEVELLTIE